MLAGTAAGMGEALTPMQLLWINLVSDVLPAIGLALEPPDADLMRQRPKQANERILTRDHLGRLGTEAGVIAAGAFAAGLYGALRHGHASPQARTVTFGSVVTAQLLHALNYRAAHGAAEGTRNSILPSVIGGSLIAQVAAILLPGLRNLLGVATIDVLDVFALFPARVLPSFVNSARKTEQVQNTTLHFRSVKPHSPPPPQAAAGRMGGERPSDLTRLLQRAAPAAASPIAATASASDTTAARALARRLQGSIP